MNQVMNFQVEKRNKNTEKFNVDKINKNVERACEGLSFVSPSEIVLDASLQLYNNVKTKEIDKALILSARSKMVKEPEYSLVAARLTLNCIYKEAFDIGVDNEFFEEQYKQAFIENIHNLVDDDVLDKRVLEFDLELLAEKLVVERDLLFKYPGIQTIYDRYLLKDSNGKILETPQAFFMRVAMGLCFNEKEKENWVIRIYDKLSQFKYMNATPTLFNSATTHPQLSSCFLSSFSDNIDGICKSGVADQGRLSKYAGGLGNDWQNIRAIGSKVRKTGKSAGLIPFLKMADAMVVAVDQEGKRKGSCCVYIEPSHPEIFEFLEMRKNVGDERRRCHNLNTALWIPDEFMERVENNDDWYMFCPSEAKDLHSIYGKQYKDRYQQYVSLAQQGLVKNYKVIKAKELWKKILTALKETGHPWITFKDPCNICYHNKNVGTVNSSNLCTEIVRHTIPSEYDKDGEKIKLGETAVCTIASLNLEKFVSKTNGGYNINYYDLKDTINVAIRALDNAIDLNFYPIPEAKLSHFNHRPVGLGQMGFANVLCMLGIPYDSEQAVQIAGNLQEFISFHAINASIELAKERGKFSSFEGSEWSKGKMPQDMFKELIEYKGFKYFSNESMDWDSLRDEVKKYGIRNADTQAIAPTATISTICGASLGIDPNFGVLYVYSTISDELTMLNEHFVNDMKKIGIWDEKLINDILSKDGDVLKIDYIPKKYKEIYKTAFDIDTKKLIDCAAARQEFIDQAQSFNVYYSGSSMKELSDIYFYAWKSGLKTTYYLRTLGASNVEKSFQTETKQCSIEAMKRGEVCESCS